MKKPKWTGNHHRTLHLALCSFRGAKTPLGPPLTILTIEDDLFLSHPMDKQKQRWEEISGHSQAFLNNYSLVKHKLMELDFRGYWASTSG